MYLFYLEVVGAIMQPKSGSQRPVTNDHEPHDDLYAEQSNEEHNPADAGSNLPSIQEDIAGPRKRFSLKQRNRSDDNRWRNKFQNGFSLIPHQLMLQQPQ